MAILSTSTEAIGREGWAALKRTGWRWLWRCALPFVLGGALLASTQTQEMDEYKVKALFLYNFAKFVEWPDDVFPSPTAPITLCVLGVDPFGTMIDEAVSHRFVGRRPLVVRRTSDMRNAAGCQILFVSASERGRVEAILNSVKGTGVLTVGETANFITAGGAIRFLLVDGSKVRFEINPHEAARQHLRISPNVLNLAKIVMR